MSAAAETGARSGAAPRDISTTSEAVEDYVRAVRHTARGPRDLASTTEVAAFLRVTPASVSRMFKKLARLGLVVYEPYRGVRLTGEGRRLALRVARRHELLEAFFGQVLGLPPARARAEADRLEHHISQDLEEVLFAYLGAPSRLGSDLASPAPGAAADTAAGTAGA